MLLRILNQLWDINPICSNCESSEQVHEKLKANINNYFDDDGCNKLLQYGKQYIQYHKKPKNIPDLLESMEKHGTLRNGSYDTLKKLVEEIDKRMLKNIDAAENAILKIEKERKKEKEKTSDDLASQGMTRMKKYPGVNQEDTFSLNNKLCEDNKPKKIEKLIEELGSMVEIMPEGIKHQYDNIKEGTSNKRGQFAAIIIAGETCAGKTTLINLLIEYNLFKDSNSPSTSAMVFLHYNEEYTIKVYKKKGLRDKLQFKACDITLLALKRYLEEFTTKAKYFVHVFYPAPILKLGVVLVDTPSFRGLDALTNYFKEMPPQQILACVFVMNASCSNWCFSENGECLPTFLVELPKCIVECEMLMGGEILFMINKWESVMTTHEDTEKFEDDAWFNIKHTIITALGRQRINQDNIYRVSLGKQMRHENDERLCREYTRFEDTVCGILEKRNTENLSALKTIAIQCRSIMKKKLKKMKKEKSKHKKWESDLKGSLTKLENVCPPVVETEESESDLEEKFIRNSKKRKKKSDDST